MNKGSRIKILIIEDDDGTRSLLHRFFAKYFKVISMSDGVEALGWIKDNRMDIILTDLNMPRINGIQFIKNIRASLVHRDSKIIVISGLDDDNLKQICHDHNIDFYYDKPFNPVDILFKIYQICDIPVDEIKKIPKK